MDRVLHIMLADEKFNIPLMNWMIEKKKFENHKFLVRTGSEYELMDSLQIIRIEGSFTENFFGNLYKFFSEVNSSNSIVLHGLPYMFLLLFLPHKWHHMSWVINGSELYHNKVKLKFPIWKKLIISNFKLHITHIEEDSILANKLINSKTKFHYSPMYLSNTVETDFGRKVKGEKDSFTILIGNSLSPSNNHVHIFENLSKYNHKIEKVICPLNYGADLGYQKLILEKGKIYFDDKFNPILNFLSLSEFKSILAEVDIAVYDHWRQEAMGVTLMLLSLGKTVYCNNKTTSYRSFLKRGFKIYDNRIVFERGPLIQDVTVNEDLLKKYYSIEVLEKSLLSLDE